jgi:hypothetical protein
MPVKDPTASAKPNHDASMLNCYHHLAASRGVEEFRSLDHYFLAIIHEVKTELKSRNQAKYDLKLNSIVSKLSCDNRRAILRGKDAGRLLSVLPSTVNGTELAKQECRDSLLLRYVMSPLDLQSHCDGCGQKFNVRHALVCKKGGSHPL